MYTGLVLGLQMPHQTAALTFANTETQTLVGQMTGKPNQDRVNAIDAWFTTVKAASISVSNLPFWVIPAAHTQQAANLNWMNPSSTAMTNGGATVPVWSRDVGYITDLTTYVDTNFNPTGTISLNSESIHAYVLAESAANTNVCGTSTSFIVPRRSTGNTVSGAAQTTTSTTSSVATMTTAIGLIAFDRSLAANTIVYKNGVLFDTLIRISASVANNNMYLGGRNSGTNTLSSGGVYTIGAAGYGTTLSLAQHAALYSATHTYLIAVKATT